MTYDRFFDGNGEPHNRPLVGLRYDDDPVDFPPPTPAQVKADAIAALYGAVVEMFMPPMPYDERDKSLMSARILRYGGDQELARKLGREVEAWRRAARHTAQVRLHMALKKIERAREVVESEGES